MICLGIESTAHTYGIGIMTDKKKVLANEKNMYTTMLGGLHPREVAQYQSKHLKEVLENALTAAGISLKEVDLIAFSQGPGLGATLKNSAITARILGLKLGVPVLGVNHLLGHIEIGKAFTGARNPVTVMATGANTQIIGYENKRYRVYGETLDIGIGKAIDVFGRALGIGFPAGPELSKLYYEGKEYIELPYTVKGMDLTFSGLVTRAKELKDKARKEDLAYSFMHTAFCMVAEVTERALSHLEGKEVLLTGGVASSKPFRQVISRMCEERKARFYVPDPEYCTDNGIQIAWQGITEYKAGRRQEIKDTITDPKQRVEQIEISWMENI